MCSGITGVVHFTLGRSLLPLSEGAGYDGVRDLSPVTTWPIREQTWESNFYCFLHWLIRVLKDKHKDQETWQVPRKTFMKLDCIIHLNCSPWRDKQKDFQSHSFLTRVSSCVYCGTKQQHVLCGRGVKEAHWAHPTTGVHKHPLQVLIWQDVAGIPGLVRLY